MRYDAFISYKKSECTDLAENLEQELIKWDRKLWRAQSLQIFRDQSDMTADPQLWDQLAARLDESDHLIVICSLDAVESEWINKEIEHWFNTRPDALENLILILASGDLTRDSNGRYQLGGASPSMPPALLEQLPVTDGGHPDLYYIDFRDFEADQKQKLDEASVGQVVATLTDRRLSEVMRTHERRRNRRLGTAVSVAVLSTLAAVLAVIFARQAQEERRVAEAATVEAVSSGLEARARTLEEQQPELAMALALESINLSDAPSPEQAESLGLAFLSRETTDFRLQFPPLSAGESPVTNIAFHPSELELTVISTDGAARVWDLESREVLHELEIPGTAWSAIYDRQGRYLAITYYVDGDEGDVPAPVGLLIIDSSTVRTLADITLSDFELPEVLFGPRSDEVFVNYSTSGIIEQRLVPSGEVAQSFHGGGGYIGDTTFGGGFDLHPNRNVVAVGTYEGTVDFWSTDDWQLIGTLEPGMDEIYDLAFGGSGETIMLASSTAIELWNMNDESRIAQLSEHRGSTMQITARPSSSMFASTSRDGRVVLWDDRTGAQLAAFDAPEEESIAPPFHPELPLLATVDAGGLINIWNLDTASRSIFSLEGEQSDEIESIAYDRSGSKIAAAKLDGSIDVWNLGDRSLEVMYCCHLGTAYAAAFDSTGGRLVSVGTSMANFDAIQVWTEGEQSSRIVNEFIVLDTASSPDGTEYVVGSLEGPRVYDWGGNTPREELDSKGAETESVAYHSTGAFIATGSRDGVIEVWDTGTYQLTSSIVTSEFVTSLDFHPTDMRLAIAGADGTISVWDFLSNDGAQSWLSHDGFVNDLAFAPSGQILGSVGDDGQIRLWYHDQGQPLITIPGHDDPATGIAFSPDGQTFATSSQDHSIRIWPIMSWHYLCGLVVEEVATEEIARFLPDGFEPTACDYNQ